MVHATAEAVAKQREHKPDTASHIHHCSGISSRDSMFHITETTWESASLSGLNITGERFLGAGTGARAMF